MKFFLIAGEASGDLHASNLMKGLKQKDAAADFVFIGGDKMIEVSGSKPITHYREMNFMGLFDVLKNLRRISFVLKLAKTRLMEFRPDAVILVDYAGFNLRLAKYAKSQGFRVFYYISPKVWAWRESRVKKLKKYVDRMFVILPFEVAYFRGHNMNAEYYGNPLTDAVDSFRIAREENDQSEVFIKMDNRPVIALLAGSRKMEIDHCLPEMVEAAASFPQYQFIVAGAPGIEKKYYERFISGSGIGIVYEKTYELLTVANAAVVTSGTATLETALFRVPQVVIYKTGWLTYRLGRLFVSFRFFSLVNLILGKELVRELLQFKIADRVEHELRQITENNNNRRDEIMQGYDELTKLVGLPGSSMRIANRMLEICEGNK